jgi:hypothetical protein
VLLQNLVFDHVPTDLKKKYHAKWALVTGASSGIKHIGNVLWLGLVFGITLRITNNFHSWK